MTDINAMIATLADAKVAMERVPELEAANSDLNNSLSICYEGKLKLEDKVAELQAQLETVQRQLAQTSDDLRGARFRESETNHRLEVLQSVVRGALDVSSPAKPEPAPEPVVQVEAEPETKVEPEPEAEAEPEAQTEPKPQVFAGQPYWSKPEAMGWVEWHQGGGSVPHWVHIHETPTLTTAMGA